MNKNNKGISTGAVIVIIIVVIGIAGAGYYLNMESSPTENQENQDKIGLITATGGLGDRSFNDISYWGAEEAAEDFDLKLDYVEPEAVAEYEGYQTDFAAADEYELILNIGFDQVDALETVAPNYPDQKFVVVDGIVTENNVASLVFNDHESAFLCGVVAGKMTETDKVGFLGGMDIPLIQKFEYGFRQGVLWANENMTENDVLVKYVGDWADIETGRSLSETMYEQGADIIYGAAGRSHLGAFRAAEEDNNKWAIGTDVDQAWSAPEHSDVIIASGLKRIDRAVYDQVERVVNDEFESGIFSYGMAENAVGFGTGIAIGDENINEHIRSSHSDVDVPNSVIQSLKTAVEDIQDGTIQIDTP